MAPGRTEPALPRRAGRRPHLPVDEALAPFAERLRQHLPSPDEIEQAAAQRRAVAGKRRAAAAVLGLAVLAGALLWADPVLQQRTLATSTGERRSWELPDGSAVQLNSGTQVQVALRLRSRQLLLERGEAAFEVAHAPWHGLLPQLRRPFTVRAGAVEVEDIGTVFNVRRDGEGAQVTVLEGRVRVRSDGGVAAQDLRAGESLWVRPGAAPAAPRWVDAGAATAWRAGHLLLDDTPLAEAVARMQPHHAGAIVLTDARVGALRISGHFDLDRIDQLLGLLPRLAPVRVQRREDGSVLISASP